MPDNSPVSVVAAPTPDTLWFRLLGKGRCQRQAIQDILDLPQLNPYRDLALQLLAKWIQLSLGHRSRKFTRLLQIKELPPPKPTGDRSSPQTSSLSHSPSRSKPTAAAGITAGITVEG